MSRKHHHAAAAGLESGKPSRPSSSYSVNSNGSDVNSVKSGSVGGDAMSVGTAGTGK